MRSGSVRRLQEFLATDPDVFSDASVTGYYGPITTHAVKHFQKHFGLDVVGVVGPKTLKKMNDLLGEHSISLRDLEDETDGDVGDIGDAEDDISDMNVVQDRHDDREGEEE